MLENTLTRPAARLALAVVVVLVVRAVLRHPVGPASPAPPSEPRAVARPAATEATPSGRSMAGDLMDQVWREMFQRYGARIAQASIRGGAETHALWQEIGAFLRGRGITGAMFKQRMTDLGWTKEEQGRYLMATGYAWSPRQTDEAPDLHARRDAP